MFSHHRCFSNPLLEASKSAAEIYVPNTPRKMAKKNSRNEILLKAIEVLLAQLLSYIVPGIQEIIIIIERNKVMKRKKITELGKEAELSMELTPVPFFCLTLFHRTLRSYSSRTNIWRTNVTSSKRKSKTWAASRLTSKRPISP